jgi:tetratricopeptide (TPR) repeat protein
MYRVIARSLAAQGQLDEAEAVAREAVRLLVQMPVHRTETLTILAHILLQNGRRSEAQEVAEEALKIVESQGGLGYTDIVSRVTAAELRSINGDLVGARAALEGALTRISLIAEKIPDAGMRQQFLTRVTENVRAQQLAQEWGLDLGGPIVDVPSGAKHH